MIPAPFAYMAPSSLDEAIGLLSSHGEEAKLLAGGQSLLPLMKLRLVNPRYLIDLGRLPGFSSIRENSEASSEGRITIGAMTPYCQIEESDLLRERCPLLPQTASVVADVQVRSRGTIGGSLAHADPTGDMSAAVLALEAELKAVGPRGARWIRAEDFFVGFFTTALSPDEILTEIRVPVLTGRSAVYLKAAHKAAGFAIVGVAVSLREGEGRMCDDIRVGVTGLTDRPFRARTVEEALRGRRLEERVVAEAAATVTEGIEVLDDVRASAAYRSHLARLYTGRAIAAARPRHWREGRR